MINITSNGKKYNATLQEDKTGFSVNVFVFGDRMPIYGTRFGLRASFENEIMPWVNSKCKKHSSGEVETIF